MVSSTIKRTKIKTVFTPWSFWQDGISPSGLSLFHRCREQFRLCYKEGLEPRYQSTSLHYGNCVHHILAQYYRGQVFTGDDAVSEWVDEYVKTAQPSVDPSVDSRQDFELAMGHAQAVMSVYFRVPSIQKQNAARIITGVEEKFKVEWPVVGTLNGTWDLVFDQKNDEWIEDTKTGQQINVGVLEDSFSSRGQFNFYLWARYLKISKFPKGIILNQIRRPGLKITKDDGNLAGHIRRVKEDVEKRPEYYFIRMEAKFRPEEIEQYAVNQLRPMMAELDLWEKGIVPHYTNHDNLVYQHSKSPYFNAIVSNDRSGLKTGGTHWEGYRNI